MDDHSSDSSHVCDNNPQTDENDKNDSCLQANVDELKQSLFCAICTEQFYRPMTLLCQHTFCGECLNGVEDKKCPVCKVNFVLPREYNRTLDLMVQTFFHETWEERDTEYKEMVQRRTVEEQVRLEIRDEVFNEVVGETVGEINTTEAPVIEEPTRSINDYVTMTLDGNVGTLLHQWLSSPVDHAKSIYFMSVFCGASTSFVFLAMLLPTIIPGTIFASSYLLVSAIVAYCMRILVDVTTQRQNIIITNTRNMMLAQMRNQRTNEPQMAIFADNQRLS